MSDDGLSFHIGDEAREPVSLPEFPLDIQVSRVVAQPRRLRAEWSTEAASDLLRDFLPPSERWRLSHARNRDAHDPGKCAACGGRGEWWSTGPDIGGPYPCDGCHGTGRAVAPYREPRLWVGSDRGDVARGVIEHLTDQMIAEAEALALSHGESCPCRLEGGCVPCPACGLCGCEVRGCACASYGHGADHTPGPCAVDYPTASDFL